MSKKRPKRKRTNLILSVAEPQRGVDEGEEDREDHSGEKDQDAAKLENNHDDIDNNKIDDNYISLLEKEEDAAISGNRM